MAYIFKRIAATQFLSNISFIYIFVNCNIFKFHNCLLNVQVNNGYFIATFSENVKNHNISQTIRDRAILSEFLTHRVVQEYAMLRENFQFSPLLVAILDFSGK